jgi:HEAT repeat protein
MPDDQTNTLLKQRLISLADDRPESYQAAYAWFVHQGPEATGALSEALDDASLGSVCHWRILLLLGHFAREETLPAVLNALHRALSPYDPVVLPGAMQALAALRLPAATQALIALLRESNTDIVKQAAALLGQTGDLAAVAPLLQLLGANNPSLRYSAARGLTQLDDPSVRDALQRHLDGETDVEVRRVIESAVRGEADTGER